MIRYAGLLLLLGLLAAHGWATQITFPGDLPAQHDLLPGAHVTWGDSHNHTEGAGAAVPESGLSLSDNTTGDVSTARHGFVPKAPNDLSTFFRGDGTWSPLPVTAPTGTGFRHVTGGVEDAAAKLVENGDVHAAAGIAESKLSLNYPTHNNANDPTADQKAALAGTNGAPSAANKYVTNSDPRNTDARTPTAHGSGYHTGVIGTWAQIDKTISNLGDLTTKSHTSLTDIGTNSHAAIDTHLVASAPHAGHEVLTSKGGANGYCPLDATTKVATSYLAGAGADATKYLRGDRAWAVPTWGEINKTTSNIADITTKSHTSLTDIGTNSHAAIDSFIASASAWNSYGATSTVTGWSSFWYKDIYYKKVGSLVYVAFYIHGVSNSTAASFTLPFASNAPTYIHALIRAADNYNWQTAGLLSLAQGASTVNFYKDASETAWTASGNKTIAGQFFYEAAP
ncbi:MAG: hypothetical protein C4567_12405 [Deltaproteobacteria bacterium]|nr:MAG: hypothetical protein C4567_12405 [Deltaproteobacteria bacterium]